MRDQPGGACDDRNAAQHLGREAPVEQHRGNRALNVREQLAAEYLLDLAGRFPERRAVGPTHTELIGIFEQPGGARVAIRMGPVAEAGQWFPALRDIFVPNR